MELKKGLTNSSSDPWYDVSDGGYLNPEVMCADPVVGKQVADAVALVREFLQACNDQIEGFEM
jgi:hypothetical protein